MGRSTFAFKRCEDYFLQDHEVFPYLPVERVAATWRMPLHKIVVAGWLRELARTEYGDADVSLVTNSVDHQQFWSAAAWKNRVPTVGLVYTPTPRKACHVALEAFRIASQQFPELRLVAFGSHKMVAPDRLPPRSEFYLLRLRLNSESSTRSATPGYSVPRQKDLDCRFWKRWPAVRPSLVHPRALLPRFY